MNSGSGNSRIYQFCPRKTDVELTAVWTIDFGKTSFNHTEQIQDSLLLVFWECCRSTRECHQKMSSENEGESIFEGANLKQFKGNKSL